MSRIGRLPIEIPAGVSVEFVDGVVTVKGAKGTLSQAIEVKNIDVKVEGNVVNVTRSNEEKETKSAHGLYRALIANMVVGVSKGFEKKLVINGVGYKLTKQGNKVVLNVGYSHPVEFVEPAGITIDVTSPTEMTVKGIDKVVVGQVAANLKAVRKPEPYHGYGIRYADETILRKPGKAAGK